MRTARATAWVAAVSNRRFRGNWLEPQSVPSPGGALSVAARGIRNSLVDAGGGSRESAVDFRVITEEYVNIVKHIGIFMRTTFDLPDELMKRAKIAAVRRGSTLRDLVAEGLRRVLTEESAPKRKRMTEAPVKLPKGHTIPIRSNQELAEMFEQEDVAKLHDVYRGR